MDLSNLKPSERMVEILSPGKKEPIGVRISLLHVDDERLKKIKRKFADEKYRLEARGKHLKAEDIENNLHELLCSAIVGWEWYNPTGTAKDKGYKEDGQATFKGSIPEFSKTNVMAVITSLPWFADQISQEVGDDTAFFQD